MSSATRGHESPKAESAADSVGLDEFKDSGATA
jgi:hypothetical protein